MTFNSIPFVIKNRVGEQIEMDYNGLQIYDHECNSFEFQNKTITHFKIVEYKPSVKSFNVPLDNSTYYLTINKTETNQ